MYSAETAALGLELCKPQTCFLSRNPSSSWAPWDVVLGHTPGNLYLCRPEFLFQGKFFLDTHLNTAHRREPGTCRHRGRSHPPRGHCTPDSLHGREHSGACLRRSGWDRTGGTHPYTGRTRACTLGWGKQQKGIYLFCSGLAHPLPLWPLWLRGTFVSPPSSQGFPGDAGGKEFACQCRRHRRYMGSVSGLDRFPGEGNGKLLQYPSLENPIDRGAWWATVHGVSKIRYDWTHTCTHPPLSQGMSSLPHKPCLGKGDHLWWPS